MWAYKSGDTGDVISPINIENGPQVNHPTT